MAAQAKAESVSITRRLLVGSMIAAPVAATAASFPALARLPAAECPEILALGEEIAPVVSSYRADPVFAAIEHQKGTLKAFLCVVDNEDVLSEKTDEKGPEWEAQRLRYDAACEANNQALDVMCETIPTTMAGLAALADYAAEIYDDELAGSLEALTVSLLETICEAAKRLQNGGRAS